MTAIGTTKASLNQLIYSMRRFKFFYFLLSCTIILGADMLMSINWTFFCFLIAATIYSYRCGLHSMWFQSSWQKLPQKAWVGLARRDLHGKKEVRSTNLCNLKFVEFSDLMLLYLLCFVVIIITLRGKLSQSWFNLVVSHHQSLFLTSQNLNIYLN